MKSLTTRSAHSVQRLACVAAALVGMAVSSSAVAADDVMQKPPVNAYAGVTYGFQVRTGCDQADTCSYARDALKLFGGYRFTPSLAAEVSYYYLGKQDRTWATGNAGAPTFTYVQGTQQVTRRIKWDETETQAIGLGVNYESEIFQVMTNHLRVGLAVSEAKAEMELDNGQRVKRTKNRVFPYFGVGLSGLLNPSFRIVSGVEVLLNPDKTTYVMTVGATGEF